MTVYSAPVVESYELRLPAWFDADAEIVNAKGWLEGVELVAADGRLFSLSFYDPLRLGQEVADALDSRGFFSEPNVVVVPGVTRTHIEEAVSLLSKQDFAGLIASSLG